MSVRSLRYLGLVAVFLLSQAGVSLPLANQAMAWQENIDIASAAAAIKQVDRFGVGNVEASKGVQSLSNLPASRLPELLGAMTGTSPLAANWFRAAAEAAAERDPNAVPVNELTNFLLERSNDPYARSLAFDLVTDRKPELREQLIDQFMDDPCLELRYMAIDRAMTAIKQLVAEDRKEEATEAYQALLQDARNPDQITMIAGELESLGTTIDLTKHFGFLTDWRLIGPFDNRDKIGFDAIYAPEDTIDFAGAYAGKEGEVTWIEHATTEANGVVNLNSAIGKHMGAVAYAYTTVVAPEEMTVSVRLGSPNGNMVWINGQLVLSNHVYHAGFAIDQYAGTIQLVKGENHILVKICQNEQTDSWAQDWQFQLRLTDESGKAFDLTP